MLYCGWTQYIIKKNAKVYYNVMSNGLIKTLKGCLKIQLTIKKGHCLSVESEEGHKSQFVNIEKDKYQNFKINGILSLISTK